MKILFLSNHFLTVYLFRRELIESLMDKGYEVYIAMPHDEKDYFAKKGCKVIEFPLDRHGMNPVKDFKLILRYIQTIKKINPDLILSYTIKPNIYGGICCKLLNKPFIPNITGLGVGMDKNIFIQKLLIYMYRLAFNRQKYVFVQNESNREFMEKNKIHPENCILIPGSGVNLNQYNLMQYPPDDTVEFFFIARVMKAKGIEEYIEAAKYCKKKKYNVKFHVLGFCEDEYEKKLKELQKQEILIYHGMSDNILKFQKINHCTINPSYHEGMSNVLLETAACGRPSLCSDIPGCNEIIDDNKSGFLFKPQDAQSLIYAIEKFLKLTYDERRKMGVNAHDKVKKKFDRNIVVNKYISVINKLLGDKINE